MTPIRDEMDPDSDDVFEDGKDFFRRTPIKAWALGVAIPLALVVYGSVCVKTRSALFIIENHHRSLSEVLDGTGQLSLGQYQGPMAIGLGTAYIGLGLFLHFYLFWSWRERCKTISQIGMYAAVLVVAEGAFYFFIQAIVG